MSSYTYQPSDFQQTATVVLDQLQQYLLTVFPSKSFYVNQDGLLVSIVFAAALTAGELTTLNTSIQNYQNVYQTLIVNANISYSDPAVILSDRKTIGTNGGTIASNTWTQRDLNYKEGIATWLTLASNRFTIPSGRYQIQISTPAYNAGTHQCALYNITSSSFQVMGTSAYGTQPSTLDTILAVNISTTFAVYHNLTGLGLLSGLPILGLASGMSNSLNETYTVVKVQKIA